MPEEKKKANLRRFLGNLKVHLKTKSAPMSRARLLEFQNSEGRILQGGEGKFQGFWDI